MTEFKGTPGKWIAAARPSSVVGLPVVSSPDGRIICNVALAAEPGPLYLGVGFNIESRENARAIAAVPEMIAALVSAPNPDGYASQDDFMDAYDAWLVAQCGTALSRALTPEEK